MIQVNDKLCCDTSTGICFTTVLAVSPSGRITLANGHVLNGDMSVRSQKSLWHFDYRIPTADDFRKHRRRVNATELDRASRMVREYTDEQLQKIADCIREVTAGAE